MRWIVIAVAVLAGCGTARASASPCDQTVDQIVDHLLDVIADENAWDETLVELFDRCPGKHALVGERINEIAAAAD